MKLWGYSLGTNTIYDKFKAFENQILDQSIQKYKKLYI